MIQELQNAINLADYTNNQKAKEILLKIAVFPEDKQKLVFNFVKTYVGVKDGSE